MKIVLMTKPAFFVEEDKILTALFDEGLDNLHLYKPGAAPVYSERLLTLLPDGFRGKFSRTCASVDEIREARRKAEYVFLKDTFSTTDDEKANQLQNARLERAADCGLIDRKVYAFGGVNIDNIRVAKELGFGGIVICNDLWDRFDIHHQLDYKELITHFERIRKMAN